MALLTNVGVFSYEVQGGTVTWDGSARTHVVERAVMDTAGRAVSYMEYTIRVEGYLAGAVEGAASFETRVATLRDRLMVSGGRLTFTGQGFGSFVVRGGQGGAGELDVKFGPRPVDLDWTPKGGGLSARHVWTVVVCLPCADSHPRAGDLLEASYSVRVTKDPAGLSTRTISGVVKIANNTAGPGSRTLLASVDAVKERFYPAVPKWFTRKRDDWPIDYAKSEVRFEIEDEEWPGRNVPAPGIVDARLSQRVVSQGAGFVKYLATISGSYRVATDRDLFTAWQSFRAVCESRYGIGANQPGKLNFAYPLSIEIVDPAAYGSRDENASFALTYLLITPPESVLRTSGVFRPLPDSNYDKWALSMAPVAWSPRGSAGLKFGPEQDAIITPCINQRTTALRPGGQVPVVGVLRPQQTVALTARLPPPNYSWLQYRMRLVVNPVDSNALHTAIATKTVAETPATSALNALPPGPQQASTLRPGLGLPNVRTKAQFTSVAGPDAFLNNTGPLQVPYPPDSGGRSIIQRAGCGRPRYYVWLQGVAVRIGYEIALPGLETVGGAEAVPMNRPGVDGFSVEYADPLGGLPVRVLRFSLRYGLDRIPGPLATPWLPTQGIS